MAFLLAGLGIAGLTAVGGYLFKKGTDKVDHVMREAVGEVNKTTEKVTNNTREVVKTATEDARELISDGINKAVDVIKTEGSKAALQLLKIAARENVRAKVWFEQTKLTATELVLKLVILICFLMLCFNNLNHNVCWIGIMSIAYYHLQESVQQQELASRTAAPSITIETDSNRTIVLPVQLDADTIHSAKELLERRLGIKISNQILLWEGKELADEHTFQHYGINANAKLVLVEVLDILVEVLGVDDLPFSISKHQATLHVIGSDSVKDVKLMIQKNIEIAAEDQIIHYANERLQNDRIMAFYGVKNDSSISVSFNSEEHCVAYGCGDDLM